MEERNLIYIGSETEFLDESCYIEVNDIPTGCIYHIREWNKTLNGYNNFYFPMNESIIFEYILFHIKESRPYFDIEKIYDQFLIENETNTILLYIHNKNIQIFRSKIIWMFNTIEKNTDITIQQAEEKEDLKERALNLILCEILMQNDSIFESQPFRKWQNKPPELNGFWIDPKVKNHGWFVEACADGDLEKVKQFIADGAKINEPTTYGVIAIEMAARNRRMDVVKLLIDNGAVVTAKTISEFFHRGPLGYSKEDKDVVKLAFEKCDDYANVKPAVWTSVLNGHEYLIKVLSDKGVSFNQKLGDDRLLTFAVKQGCPIGVLQHLIDYGAVAWLDDSIALCFAKNVEVAKLLVTHGAKVTANNNQALKFAHSGRRTDVVKYLMSQGATMSWLEK